MTHRLSWGLLVCGVLLGPLGGRAQELLPYRTPAFAGQSKTDYAASEIIQGFEPTLPEPLQLLLDPLVIQQLRSESEASDEQRLNHAVALVRQHMTAAETGGSSRRRGGAVSASAGWGKELRAEVDEILSTQQQLRLAQLGRWQQIRRWGLERLLQVDGWGSSLQLSPEQRQRLARSAARARRQLRSDVQDLEWSLTERLADVLTPAQRQKLWKRLGSREDWRDYPLVSLDRLKISLNHSRRVRELNRRDGIPDDFVHDRHLAGFDGQLESVASSEQLLLLPDVQERLQLSVAQVEQVGRVTRHRRQQESEIQRQFSLRRRQNAPPAELALQELELEAVQRESREKLLDDILLPHQRAELDRLATVMRVRTIGLLPLLTDGSLGNDLAVSSTQRLRLFSLRAELKSELETQHAEAVLEYQRCLIAGLPQGLQQGIEHSLGDLPGVGWLADPVEILARRQIGAADAP